MKKNLIGIVAAGLALALAFTGCESGSDSPVKYATDLDNPVTKGSKFVYKVSPTEWSYAAATGNSTAGTTETDEAGEVRKYDANGTVGYSYNLYVDGVQNFNRTDTKTWGKADKSKLTVGDVINTKSETITLDSKTNTFTLDQESSAYEVKELKEKTSVAGYTDKPWETHTAYYLVTDGTEDLTADNTDPTGFTGTKAKTHAAAATIFEDAKKTTAVLQTQAQKALDDAYAALSPADKAIYDAYKTDEEHTATGAKLKTQWDVLKTAKTNAEAAANNFEWATVMSKGAKYSVLSTTTKNGATTGNLVYYGSDKKTVIDTVSKAGGTAKVPASGSYTISGSSYKEATIVVTTYKSGDDTIVFTDADDYYYKNSLRGKISEDFPVATMSNATASATAPKTGSNLQKAARTLKISGGVLTAPAVITSYLDGVGTTSAVKEYAQLGYLFGSSYTTRAASKADVELIAAGNAGTQGTAATKFIKPVSYSYTLAN